MANNRIWLVCRFHEPDEHGFTAADNRWIIAKHFMDGWQRREHMPDLEEWLEKHEACFFEGTGQEGWDHQFALEYED